MISISHLITDKPKALADFSFTKVLRKLAILVLIRLTTNSLSMGMQLKQEISSFNFKTVLKQNSNTNCQNRHHGYCPQHDHINKLERREQTTIRSASAALDKCCGLKKHQKKIGLAAEETAQCECGSG